MSEAKEVFIAGGFGLGVGALLTAFNPIIAATVATVGFFAQVAHDRQTTGNVAEYTVRNVVVAGVAASGAYFGLSSPFAMSAADIAQLASDENTKVVKQVVEERPAVQTTTLQAKPD